MSDDKDSDDGRRPVRATTIPDPMVGVELTPPPS